MESCINYKPERVGAVTVEDLRKDLFVEFSKICASQENVLQQREHLQVYLRVRPFTTMDNEFGESQDYISIENPDTVILKAPRFSLTARQSEKLGPQVAQRFQFSQVYGPETTQQQMFDGTTKSLVKGVLGGENSLVFTYGVTNAGKTFTFLGPESDAGILPRSLNVIFNSIEGRVYTQNIIKPHRCIDFTRLTKDQQEEEAKTKKNLLRRFKESDLQKSMSSMSSSASSSLIEGSSYSELDGDSFCLEDDSRVNFSVWVSFCEIYNENIHDLLDFSHNSQRRSALRLCQDVKGNTFVKDVTWIQVNSAVEAYKILKIGKKNQSFSSTKLNSVSSRSHSIFSIRILKIEDTGVPRVQSISELSLCDLAGSERCAKTQNRGERLKEAGNINTSLLTLGKCMNALRLSQTQSKFQQHIPFRESKLTHYLQGFFCGRGKACMIVNINQCASMYDETLNVLKFSALAQKVVVLNPRPVFTVAPKKSAREVSMMINNVDRREWSRRSTLIGWESSLEDVQEDEDCEDMESDEEESDDESMVEQTVLEAPEDEDLGELKQKIKQLQEQLSKAQSEKLAMESYIRDEVTAEFMNLFSNMEKDYSERLQREKEIAEERAERRLEILKNLVNKTTSELDVAKSAEDSTKETKIEALDGMIETMQNDLAKIREDAEAAQSFLETENHSSSVSKLKAQLDDMAKEVLKYHQLLSIKTKETEAIQVQFQKSTDHLLEANKNYENQNVKCQKLMDICQEKDKMISKLQTALDQNVEEANENRAFIDNIKTEILHYRNNCKCLTRNGKEMIEDVKIEQLVKTIKEKDDLLEELKRDQDSLNQKLKSLTEDLIKRVHAWEEAVSLLETEKAATTKLTNENQVLTSELDVFQQEASKMKFKFEAMEKDLDIKTTEVSKLSAKLQTAQAVISEHEEESDKLSKTIVSLKLEAEDLRQKLHAQEISQGQENNSVFQKTIESLRKECETMLMTSLEKSRKILALEQEVGKIKEEISRKQKLCDQLEQERDAQKEENENLHSNYQAERLNVKQMERCCSKLEEDLDAVQQQLIDLKKQEQVFTQSSERLRELEEYLPEKEARCADLEQKLLQTQHKLNQAGEDLKLEQCRRTEDKEKMSLEISKASDEAESKGKDMEEELASKHKELEAEAKKLLQSRKQVDNGLDTIQSLRLDLEQKEKHISDLQAKLNEATVKMMQLNKESTSMTEEIRMLQQKLKDMETDKDQALVILAKKEQTIKELEANQSTQVRSQQVQESSQDNMHLNLFNEERTQTEQEPLLEASEVLLKKYKREFKTDADKSHQDDTGHLTQTAMQNASVLSTVSKGEKHFPKPQMEISFSPLKPNQLNVRRPGDTKSITVKITRTGRKRKSADIENSVELENRKNMRLQENSKSTVKCLASPSVLGKKASHSEQQNSPVSQISRKDGTLQKIGDFIQSSPTLLRSKAKKIMAKVVLKSPESQITGTSNKPKRSKRKLFKTQISSPLDIPSHPVIGIDLADKESDHLVIKRKLRTRTSKK